MSLKARIRALEAAGKDRWQDVVIFHKQRDADNPEKMAKLVHAQTNGGVVIMISSPT